MTEKKQESDQDGPSARLQRLSEKQRKGLASEARALAMECADGRMPALQWHTYCGCAAHEVAVRAGFGSRGEPTRSAASDTAEAIANLISFDDEERQMAPGLGFWHLIDVATYLAVTGSDPGALVFPLLATADALETRRSRK